MPAVPFDFTVEQGTDYSQLFIKKDGNGDPVDLLGYTAHMQVRARPGAPVLLDMTTENDLISIDGPNGAVYLVFTEALLLDAPWKRGKYQIELRSPAGKTSRLAYGVLSISLELVKP